MFLTVCETCQTIALHVRRPRWLRFPGQRLTACRARHGRCRGPLRCRDRVPRAELVRHALEFGRELANTGEQQERVRDRVHRALEEFDHRAIVRENVEQLYPDAPWYVQRQKLRQLLEEKRREEQRRRREAHERQVAVARARRDLERARDRLERRPHTTGLRRPAHYAPDCYFANRRVAGVMPPDRARDAAPIARDVRRRLRRRPRSERRDPTCGGFYRPDDGTPTVPAHARRAQLKYDVARDLEIELEKIRRAGIRRRPGGRAA